MYLWVVGTTLGCAQEPLIMGCWGPCAMPEGGQGLNTGQLHARQVISKE